MPNGEHGRNAYRCVSMAEDRDMRQDVTISPKFITALDRA